MNDLPTAPPRHQLVHQERRPGHVAAVFEQRDEQEQDHDLRQEDEHPADAADHAVDQQAAQRPGDDRAVRPATRASPCPSSIESMNGLGPGVRSPGRRRTSAGEEDQSPATRCVRTRSIRSLRVTGRTAGLRDDALEHLADPRVADLRFDGGNAAIRPASAARAPRASCVGRSRRIAVDRSALRRSRRRRAAAARAGSTASCRPSHRRRRRRRAARIRR